MTACIASADGQIRDVRSKNFLLHTDLGEEDARDLLERMETMLGIISKYWRAPNRNPIECYVADDVKKWPASALTPQLRDIVSNRGITMASGVQRGRQVRMTAKVFASNQYGTPLHEAVHAYCFQTFGTTGPVWYSEGMAEMGNFWKDGTGAVNAPGYVIQYLRQAERTPIKTITEPGQKTGDGWRFYAWRWALCHFLANNKNYRERFRVLGNNLLQRRSASFDRTFRSNMPELEFEFEFFMKHLRTGLDAERMSWDWTVRAKELAAGKTVKQELEADRGWQPLRLKAEARDRFILTLEGSWQVVEGEDVDPATAEGPGSLVAAVYSDHTLSEEFRIRPGEEFSFPSDGQLVLRCKDEWHSISDNSGIVKITVTPAAEETCLLYTSPSPRDS